MSDERQSRRSRSQGERARALLSGARALVMMAVLFGMQSTAASAQGMGSSQPQIGRATVVPPHVRSSISLEDIAARAGLKFQHVSGESYHKKFLLESTGSGVAIFDYDGDGLPDILLINGDRWNPVPGPRPVSRLFKNMGNYRFRDVTQEAGLNFSGWGQGVCIGDYDNDGYDDIFITYFGHNVLYHNDDHGHFRDVTAEAGLPTQGSRWNTGCAFVDYDRDGRLDIAVANYASFDPKTAPTPGSNALCHFKGLPVVCGPRGLAGGTNLLYHNLGSGHFEDVSHRSHFDEPSGHYCFSVIASDFDDDAWPDLFLACDSTPNILLHNNHDGTFQDTAIASGTAFNDNGEEQGSMGADAGDYDRSGHASLIVTTFDDDIPALFLGDGRGSFDDVNLQTGLGLRTHQVGWGTAFVDLDNSGWLDVFMVNGHVYPNVDTLGRAAHFREGKYLYHNQRNGKFADVTQTAGPAVSAPDVSRGLAYGDFNNDGSLSLVINNLGSAPNLLVNRGPKGNWVTLHLVGTTSNRDAVGARVKLTAANGAVQTAEVRSGCCYLSQSDMRLHFGLGVAAGVEHLGVRWPSGLREEFSVTGINRVVQLVEGKGVRQDSMP